MVWRGRGDFETNRAIAKQRGSLSIGKKWLEKSAAYGARGRELLSEVHDGFLLGCSYLTTNTEVSYLFIITRETREGCPLLIVATEAYGDSRSTSEKGSFLGWIVGLVVPVQEIFSCLGCFSRPSTIIFPHCTLFHFICPHRPVSWARAGSRAGSPVS